MLLEVWGSMCVSRGYKVQRLMTTLKLGGLSFSNKNRKLLKSLDDFYCMETEPSLSLEGAQNNRTYTVKQVGFIARSFEKWNDIEEFGSYVNIDLWILKGGPSFCYIIVYPKGLLYFFVLLLRRSTCFILDPLCHSKVVQHDCPIALKVTNVSS